MKQLRLAKISTLEGANAFLEKEYWPEWNARFARPVADFPNHHRALTPQLDLAAILCHVEQRVIGNDYTFSFAGRRYQIARAEVQAGMRRQRLRVELRLDGELRARYQGRYLEIGECGARAIAASRPGQTGSQRSQRGRQEFLDAGVLRSPQPAAVEVDRSLRREGQCGNAGQSARRIFAFVSPKPPLGKFHQKQNASHTGKPSGRAGPVSPGCSIAGGLAPTASGANSVASALGNRTRRDPGAAVRTYHGVPKSTLKTGTFYLAGKRNFLLGSDTSFLTRVPRTGKPHK